MSSRLNGTFAEGIDGSQMTFVRSTSDAGSDLNGLGWGFLAGSIVVALLVLIGFQPRIAEYR